MRAAALTILLSLAPVGVEARPRERREPTRGQPSLGKQAFIDRWEPGIRAAPVEIVAAPAPEVPLATPSNPLTFAPGSRTPRGYFAIPGTRTALRIAGVLKLDAIHDTGPYSGDYSDLPNLPLRGATGAGEHGGLTRFHARESGIALGTFSETAAGPLVAFIEMDFYGAGGFNTYGLRMSQAYVSWGPLLAGHTYSNFLDVDARGTTIEFNGPTGAGNRKRGQIRVTARAHAHLLVALALENGAADYTQPDGTRVVAADTTLAQGSDVAQRLPDLTAHVRLHGDVGHVGLRAMARQLRLQAGAGPVRVLHGHGLALSGKWQPHGRSNLFAQVTGGLGLGGFVDDLDGQAATFDRDGRRFVRQLGYASLVGAELIWSERWRSHVIASVSGVELARIAPRGDQVRPLSRRFVQAIANAIYAPTSELLLGLEYAYYRRETNTPLVGYSHRLQVGVLYRFGI